MERVRQYLAEVRELHKQAIDMVREIKEHMIHTEVDMKKSQADILRIVTEITEIKKDVNTIKETLMIPKDENGA